MKPALAIAVLVLTGTAWASEPDDATKIWALKRAYQINNGEASAWGGGIDLSNETPEPRVIPLTKAAPLPVAQANPEHSKPAEKARVQREVCAAHGMRRVTIRHGRSWRCRR